MAIHQYRDRYLLEEGGKDERLTAVRYRCKSCGRTITVLDDRHSAHRVIGGKLLLKVLSILIVLGRTSRIEGVSRQWQRAIMRRWREEESGVRSIWPDKASRLAHLGSRPGFCVMRHGGYERVEYGSCGGEHQRVCLDAFLVAG